MKIRTFAIAALLTVSLPMLADTTYTYTGTDYTISWVNNQPQNPPGTIAAPYSATGFVSGSFTLSGNVDNLSNANYFNPGPFSFSDGVQTINNTDGTLFAQISTDASGDITSYVLQAQSTSNSTDIIQIGSSGSPSSYGKFVLPSGTAVAAESNTPGSFAAPLISSTPEPSSLILLGTGLVGAFGMVRRRSAA